VCILKPAFKTAAHQQRKPNASLKGFAAGFERAANAQALQAMLQDDDSPQAALIDMATTGNASPAAVQALPAAVREFAQLGYQRLLDYQGTAYANLYVARLQTVLNAENAADPAHVQGHAASRHTARWLALWMAFDDIVRVADLKSRASRWQRVAAEVKLQPGELLRVYDHFKPGVPELAALLPNALATPLLRWHNQRLAKGLEPLAWALKIGSHSVLGLLALRGLASLKWLRPHGSRFGQEQHDIRRHGCKPSPRACMKTGLWVANSRNAVSSSKAMAAPTNAPSATCSTSLCIWPPLL
jgi:indolepyruvate ferredoxin oxidoreductase, beta subunit